MTRWALYVASLLGCAGACREPALPLPALPEIAVPRARMDEIPPAVRWQPGEHLMWNVRANGFSVARATLTVTAAPGGDLEMVAELRSTRLAAARSANDAVSVARVSREGRVIAGAHGIAAALASVRAWAAASPVAPGTLAVVHRGRRYRVVVQSPVAEVGGRRLRIDCWAVRIPRTDGEPIRISLWFADDAERTPEVIEVAVGALRLVAERAK